jgi:hypothetical protein
MFEFVVNRQSVPTLYRQMRGFVQRRFCAAERSGSEREKDFPKLT